MLVKVEKLDLYNFSLIIHKIVIIRLTEPSDYTQLAGESQALGHLECHVTPQQAGLPLGSL